MGAFLVLVCQPQPSDGERLGLHIKIRRRHFIRDNQRAVAQAGPVLWSRAAASRCLFARRGSQRGFAPLVVFPPFLPAERGPARRAKRVWGHAPYSKEAILWLKAEPCPQGAKIPGGYPCPAGQTKMKPPTHHPWDQHKNSQKLRMRNKRRNHQWRTR